MKMRITLPMVALGIGGLGLAAAAGMSAASAQSAVPAVDWKALTKADVQAAYAAYVGDHPGMVDPNNRGFPAQLARARDAALKVADRAVDESDYVEALGAFTAGLQDGHAQLQARPSAAGPLPLEWPNFVAAWRGDRLLVHHAGEGFPFARGTVITGCDGDGVKDTYRRKLHGTGFRADEAGGWWFWGPRMFSRSAVLAKLRPTRCTFAPAGGQAHELALDWQAAPQNFRALLDIASDGDRTPIGLIEPRPGVFLVGLPNFQPDDAEIKAYGALYETLGQRHAELARAKALVIDLRYNNGGSSSWSRRTADALWGQPTVSAKMGNLFANTQIWWRASPGNLAYLEATEPQLRLRDNVTGADSFKAAAAGIRTAMANREPFFREDASSGPTVAVPPTDFATPVYVITPGRCGSACLDAIDVFKQFENVRLIGAPTSADSSYMEVRPQDLPSRRGRMMIPTKLWAERPRKGGQIYTPDIPVTDLDWKTAMFLDRIETDLARRGTKG